MRYATSTVAGYAPATSETARVQNLTTARINTLTGHISVSDATSDGEYVSSLHGPSNHREVRLKVQRVGAENQVQGLREELRKLRAAVDQRSRHHMLTREYMLRCKPCSLDLHGTGASMLRVTGPLDMPSRKAFTVALIVPGVVMSATWNESGEPLDAVTQLLVQFDEMDAELSEILLHVALVFEPAQPAKPNPSS